MDWDLGLQGVLLMALLSLAFGVVAGVLVGGDRARRARAAVLAATGCFVAGLLTSEVLFGWATEEELQPNVDGLSRDEVLLSSVLVTAVVVIAVRYVAHRTGAGGRPAPPGRQD